MKIDSRNSVSGPARIDVTSTISHVRRSRSASLSSLRKTVHVGVHCVRLRHSYASLTNASSSDSVPASARICCAVPCATVRPRATITISSASCSTSCMMCDEMTMHLPCIAQMQQQPAQRARRDNVESVGRLVENQVMRVMDQRACERDLQSLAGREAFDATFQQRAHVEQLGHFRKPLAAEPRSVRCAAARSTRRFRARSAACTARARRTARRAARAQRAYQLARRCPPTRACPRSAFTSVPMMRSVVVLPAPFGPSIAVMRPSVGDERHIFDRDHARALAVDLRVERLGKLMTSIMDFDHGFVFGAAAGSIAAKKLGAGIRARQSPSTRSNDASRTKREISIGAQP